MEVGYLKEEKINFAISNLIKVVNNNLLITSWRYPNAIILHFR